MPIGKGFAALLIPQGTLIAGKPAREAGSVKMSAK
jgi:hypothetical protein